MMILLLFLASCVSTGFSYNKEYGKEFKMLLLSTAKYIEFNRMDSPDQTLIVWKQDDPPAREDSRRKVEGIYFVIKKITQLDSGLYIVRDKNGREISSKSLEVYEKKKILIRGVTEELRVGFDLEPNSCNIYFFPEKDEVKHTVARRGKQWETLYCQGLTLLRPCELENNNLEMSCSGRFEFRDLNDNKAFVVKLIMKSPPFKKSYIGIGAGIFSAVLSCCCCLKRVCCGKSSSKNDQSETPNDDEPAVYYHEYENEPAGPGPEQLNPPFYTPTVPLIHNPPTTYDPAAFSEIHNPPTTYDPAAFSEIHNPPTMDDPPAFSEIHNPPTMDDPPAFSEVYPPAQQEDVPTVPVLSDTEPRFEVTGLTFPSAPPLSSDSTGCDVYTSDKLNFL